MFDETYEMLVPEVSKSVHTDLLAHCSYLSWNEGETCEPTAGLYPERVALQTIVDPATPCEGKQRPKYELGAPLSVISMALVVGKFICVPRLLVNTSSAVVATPLFVMEN